MNESMIGREDLHDEGPTPKKKNDVDEELLSEIQNMDSRHQKKESFKKKDGSNADITIEDEYIPDAEIWVTDQ